MMKYVLSESLYAATVALNNRLKKSEADNGDHYRILWINYLEPFGHYSILTVDDLPVRAMPTQIFRLLLDNKTFWRKCQVLFKYTDRKQLMTYLDLGFLPDDSFFMLVPKEALASAVNTLVKRSEVE